MGKGMLVVFEGIEGSGKTTQAKLLHESISKEGIGCALTKEPSDSSITRLIRDELKKSSDAAGAFDTRSLQLLFTADRSVHVEKMIRPRLEAGDTVVVDRYLLSTIAYASAFGDASLADYLMQVNDVFPKPDLVFYIRVSPEAALKRVSARENKERYDNLNSLRKQDAAYLSLARRYYSGEGSPWVEIDGDRGIPEVASDVLAEWRKRSGRS